MSFKERSLQRICLSSRLENYNHSQRKHHDMKNALVDNDDGFQQFQIDICSW